MLLGPLIVEMILFLLLLLKGSQELSLSLFKVELLDLELGLTLASNASLGRLSLF